MDKVQHGQYQNTMSWHFISTKALQIILCVVKYMHKENYIISCTNLFLSLSHGGGEEKLGEVWLGRGVV